MRISDWSSDVCSSDLQTVGSDRYRHVADDRAATIGYVAQPRVVELPNLSSIVDLNLLAIGEHAVGRHHAKAASAVAGFKDRSGRQAAARIDEDRKSVV